MKKLIIFLAATLFTTILWAQNQGLSPKTISYQAIIRGENDYLLKNQSLGMQISILKGSQNGNPVYVERHFPTTNFNGLVSIEIGAGTAVNGVFSNINWANGPYFIKSETDLNGGANYTIIGTSQILSVPYAMHAKTAEKVLGTVVVGDNSITSAKIRDGEVKRNDIASNAIGANEIAANAVGASEVADGSLTGSDIANGSIYHNDLGDEVGLDFSGSGYFDIENLATCNSATVITSVSVTAPTSGFIVVTASGKFCTYDGGEYTYVMLDDSPSGLVYDGRNFITDSESTHRACGVGQSTPFAFQYVYSVSAGTHTYYLKGCSKTTANGDGNLDYNPMIAIFVPTKY